MTLTANQKKRVQDDISRILKETPKISAEEVFEKLNRAYIVSLTDIKSIIAELRGSISKT